MTHLFFISLIASELLYKGADKTALIVFGLLGLVNIINARRVKIDKGSLLLLLFSLYLFISWFFYTKSNINTMFYSVLFLLQAGLLRYIIVNTRNNPEYIKEKLMHFVGWQSIVAMIGILDFLLFINGIVTPIHDYSISWKVSSFYSNPNIFGIISALSFSLALAEYTPYSRYRYPIMAVCASAVLISGSSMALGVAVSFVLISKFSLKTFLSIVLVLVLVLSLDSDLSDLSELLNKRLEIWMVSITMFLQDNYIIGIGSGNFQILNDEFTINHGINETLGSHLGLHSMYLWLIVETGILGVIIFLSFIVNFFKSSYKVRAENRIFNHLMIVILISQFTEFYLDHVEIFIMLFMIVISSGAFLNRKNLNEK